MPSSAPYEIRFADTALTSLEGLPKKLRRQIIEKVERLASDFRPPGCKLVRGMDSHGEPIYRIRQGDYRVLYVVLEPLTRPVVLVLDIGHRSSIYD